MLLTIVCHQVRIGHKVAGVVGVVVAPVLSFARLVWSPLAIFRPGKEERDNGTEITMIYF